MDIDTLDQLIEYLQKLREKHGGECRVLGNGKGSDLFHLLVMDSATGKSKPFKMVSRGGNPCVVFTIN